MKLVKIKNKGDRVIMLITSGVIALVVGGLTGFAAGQPQLFNELIVDRLTSLKNEVGNLSEQVNGNSEKLDTLMHGKITTLEDDMQDIKTNTEKILRKFSVG